MSSIRDSIVEEVIEERKRQDEIYGGEVHDNLHTGVRFIGIIECYTQKALVAGRHSYELVMRKRLIQVAALAIAAIESFDRYYKHRGGR